MTQDPSMTSSPAPSPDGSPPARRRGVLVVVGAVLGGLVVLAALVVGAIWLVDSRDDPIETAPAPTTTAAAEPAGELHELLLDEAEVVTDADGGTWVLDDTGWVETAGPDPDALEAYSGTYTSDAGSLTLSALSFSDEEAAQDHLEQVMADGGDPAYEGPVREDGSGTRVDYETGADYTIHWRDDGSAFVFAVTADSASAESFYGGLPF